MKVKKDNKTGQSFLAGAVIISLGGFISKILGAVYRIPLTNILGGEGMGIYQMVYPLYCILLTVSASGIPTGISRLISSGKGSGAERQAFRLYGVIGVIGTLIMYLLSAPLAAVQGEPAIALCCKLLCPSVFFVSMLSVVRGYFQGKGNMFPTATTEVLEQAVKVGCGVALSYALRDNLALAVAMTLLAVTVSEIISTGIAVVWYFTKRAKRPLYAVPAVPVKSILRFTVPLTLTAIALPVSQLVESIVAVRLLRAVDENATALYGIFSGCAVTIINLPVSVTYGLAASSVPQISPLAESGNFAAAKKKAFKALFITFIVSLPAAVGLFFLAPLATRLIFGSLEGAEKQLLIDLIRIMAVSSVTESLVQTSSACLTALGSPVKSTVTQWTSAILRVALTAALIAFTSLSISGAAWSANCAYLVAMLMNFWYIIRVGNNGKRGKANENHADRIGDFGRRLNAESKGGA
ncbi:MAG: polysaccharide biosynthesis protein [Clostridia bacterium]|nr:polysaccharide biosynthesis protein [Clostridia bacterium]